MGILHSRCRQVAGANISIFFLAIFFSFVNPYLSGYFGPEEIHRFHTTFQIYIEDIRMHFLATLAFLVAMTFTVEADCPRDENGELLEEFSIDGCNMCTCDNDRPSCTEMACPGECHMGYLPDTCNMCSCDAGTPICTLAACPSWYD